MAQVEGHVGLRTIRRVASVAVYMNAPLLGQRSLHDLKRLSLGLANVNDDRLGQLHRKLELELKDSQLVLLGRAVVVKVQATLWVWQGG